MRQQGGNRLHPRRFQPTAKPPFLALIPATMQNISLFFVNENFKSDFSTNENVYLALPFSSFLRDSRRRQSMRRCRFVPLCIAACDETWTKNTVH